MPDEPNPFPLFDIPTVRAILLESARARRSISYAELLFALGYAFSRPKMRTLCKVLGRIDEIGEAAGEPELAVLVVRQSDGMPGAGWWIGRRTLLGHRPLADNADPARLVRKLQKQVFDYWASAKPAEKPKPKKPNSKPKPARS